MANIKYIKKKKSLEQGETKRERDRASSREKIPCPICSQEFNRNSMPKHIRTHGINPEEESWKYTLVEGTMTKGKASCAVCGKTFASKSIRNHVRIHKDEESKAAASSSKASSSKAP